MSTENFVIVDTKYGPVKGKKKSFKLMKILDFIS